MRTLEEMQDNDRKYREYRMFHERVDNIVKRWAPNDLREQAEFTADLMSLFRELMIGQAQVYSDAVSRQMGLTLQMGSLLPNMPILKDEK